ncbi:hypothetical protein B0H14DRAFT_1310565 [Mycena olivaceomarginata]|nr:hypothetical protein B0H14DRAFT_1310565 [Mycena olivaceomarginata]
MCRAPTKPLTRRSRTSPSRCPCTKSSCTPSSRTRSSRSRRRCRRTRASGTFINDNGLRLLSLPDCDERLAHYANHQPPLKRALSPAEAHPHRVVPAPAPHGLARRVDQRALPARSTCCGDIREEVLQRRHAHAREGRRWEQERHLRERTGPALHEVRWLRGDVERGRRAAHATPQVHAHLTGPLPATASVFMPCTGAGVGVFVGRRIESPLHRVVGAPFDSPPWATSELLRCSDLTRCLTQVATPVPLHSTHHPSRSTRHPDRHCTEPSERGIATPGA